MLKATSAKPKIILNAVWSLAIHPVVTIARLLANQGGWMASGGTIAKMLANQGAGMHPIVLALLP